MTRLQRFCVAASLASIVIAVSGCGLLKDRSNEYLKERSGKELVVPEWYSADKIRPAYQVPEIENQRALPPNYVLPGPPDATAALTSDPFVIENAEDQTWLHLFTAPGKVWPLLDFFWGEYRIELDYENVTDGYLVTSPKAFADLRPELLNDSEFNIAAEQMVYFQAKLAQGVRRNTAELELRVLEASSDGRVVQEWQLRSVYPELEKLMLSRIGEFVTSEKLENRYSLLANDIGGGSKVRLLKDEAGIGFLEMQLSFQRAWSELGQALDAAGVVVAEFDREERVYYISYLQEDDLSSWYSLGPVDQSKRLEQNLSLELSADENGSIIVRAKSLNPRFTAEQAETLLNLVFEHIS